MLSAKNNFLKNKKKKEWNKFFSVSLLEGNFQNVKNFYEQNPEKVSEMSPQMLPLSNQKLNSIC